jgi:hypothetical protein
MRRVQGDGRCALIGLSSKSRKLPGMERCLSIVRVVVLGAAGVAAAVASAGCGLAGTDEAAPRTRTAADPPVVLHGEAARAARAVDRLARALRDGDVERLCRAGAVFTSAVVAEMDRVGGGCEASLELSSELRHPPALRVTRLAYEVDLATAEVRVGRHSTIPLDIVRDGRRWLVSFSDGLDPIGALNRP